MHLINTSTLELHQVLGDATEEYAILSHTWGEDECIFQDMLAAEDIRNRKAGYQKIKFCCEQAAKDGLKWAWVDTCCIDKTNHAELSEAINSMFRWYRKSRVCYAYLADATETAELASSRWFTRGWTLQELIAPNHVLFYSSNWTYLGSKSDMADIIQEITGIDAFVLSTGNFTRVSVAQRMSWAAKRKTTLIEDMSYSLVGIFNIVMPFIYGEGKRAFLRLQQEIMKVSDDQSLFAWGAPEAFRDIHSFLLAEEPQMHNIFADSPADFLSSHEILKASRPNDPPPVILTNGLVQIEYPVYASGHYKIIMIGCTTRRKARAYIGIPMKVWGHWFNFYARCGPLLLVYPEHWEKFDNKKLIVKEPDLTPAYFPSTTFQIVRVPNKTRPRKQDQFVLDEVYCLPHARYDASEHSIAFSPDHRGLQAALFFTPSAVFDSKRESTRDGIFPLRAFAVVLGYSESPWTVFVPILHDAHAEAAANMDQLRTTTTQTARYCTRKDQLKDILSREDLDALPPGERHFSRLLSVWAEPRHGGSFVQRNTEISVDLKIEPINLVDEAVFVSIDIREVTVDGRAPKPQFVHSFDMIRKKRVLEQFTGDMTDYPYRRDWIMLDKLEWFMN